jgi:hypothetical protein
MSGPSNRNAPLTDPRKPRVCGDTALTAAVPYPTHAEHIVTSVARSPRIHDQLRTSSVNADPHLQQLVRELARQAALEDARLSDGATPTQPKDRNNETTY